MNVKTFVASVDVLKVTSVGSHKDDVSSEILWLMLEI